MNNKVQVAFQLNIPFCHEIQLLVFLIGFLGGNILTSRPRLFEMSASTNLINLIEFVADAYIFWQSSVKEDSNPQPRG